MSSRSAEAEALRIGYFLGIIPVEDLVLWADEQVMQASNPGTELLELSTCAKRTSAEITECLRALAGGCDRILAARIVLRRVRQMLIADPARGEELADLLQLMWWQGLLPSREFGHGPGYLEIYFLPMEDSGIDCSPEQARAILDAFLAKHEAPRGT